MVAHDPLRPQFVGRRPVEKSRLCSSHPLDIARVRSSSCTPFGWLSLEDRLDDVRRQKSQSEQPADETAATPSSAISPADLYVP
jgi:hypothetical protein